jgi:hypothetical protein
MSYLNALFLASISRKAQHIKAHVFEEIFIFSNISHLEWRAELSDTILKGTQPGTIPARLGLIWVSRFRGEDSKTFFP